MEANNNTNSVFINGKAQIIEMLQHMPREERSRLLKNLQVRNPQLAEELTEQCFTFSDLDNLADNDLLMIFQYVTAPILGMALKILNVPSNVAFFLWPVGIMLKKPFVFLKQVMQLKSVMLKELKIRSLKF